MLNGHKSDCPICGEKTIEAQIAFTDFVKLSEKERELYKLSVANHRPHTSVSQ